MLFKRRKNFRVKLVVFISLALLILFSLNLIREILNRRQIDRQINNLKKEVSNLERDNTQIDSMIESWSTESHLEREARLKLGLKKPGENVALILREGTSSLEESISGESEKVGNILVPIDKKIPNPVKWWKYFFK